MKRLTTILTIGVFATLYGCGQNKSNSTNSNNLTTQSMTKPVENITATKDQRERRAISEAFCKSKKIPIYTNPNSLFVDSEDKITIRTQNEVVDRALAPCYIGLKGKGLDQKRLDDIDKNFNISTMLSSTEKDFATAKQPTEQQKTDATWRYESLHVMLWSLGFIDTLNYPDQMCNVASDVKIIHDLTERQFRQKAKLRTKKEILNEADLILRLDWACVSARVKNEPAPSGLDKGVVYERHYSLNWLIEFMNQEWDNVKTDT